MVLKLSVSYVYGYNANNILNTIKDGESNTYSIDYSSNKATKVTYPNGENYILGYNASSTTLLTKKNENGATIYTETTNFDTTTGKVLKEVDVDGNATTYNYNNTNNPYLVTSTTKKMDYQELDSNNIVVNKNKEV